MNASCLLHFISSGFILLFLFSFFHSSQYENDGRMSPFKRFNIPKTQPDENQSLQWLKSSDNETVKREKGIQMKQNTIVATLCLKNSVKNFMSHAIKYDFLTVVCHCMITSESWMQITLFKHSWYQANCCSEVGSWSFQSEINLIFHETNIGSNSSYSTGQQKFCYWGKSTCFRLNQGCSLPIEY